MPSWVEPIPRCATSAGDLDTLQSVETTATGEKISANEKAGLGGLGTDTRGVTLLMSSTPLAYPQVVSRCLVSFRVVNSGVSADQVDFRAWFDSRQLH